MIYHEYLNDCSFILDRKEVCEMRWTVVLTEEGTSDSILLCGNWSELRRWNEVIFIFVLSSSCFRVVYSHEVKHNVDGMSILYKFNLVLDSTDNVQCSIVVSIPMS